MGRRGARFLAAEMRRQQTAMMNEMTEQMMRFWMGAWMPPSSNPWLKNRR